MSPDGPKGAHFTALTIRLERPFRLTALELLLPVPQFTGAITAIANGPLAALASVGLITAIAAADVPLDTLAAVGGSTGGALLIYLAPALMALKLRAATPDGAPDGALDGAPDGDGAVAATGSVTALGAAGTVGLWGLAAVGVALAVIGTVDSVGRLL